MFVKIGKQVVNVVSKAGSLVIKAGTSILNKGKSVLSKVGSGIKKLFGRRAIDGPYYVIVDNDYEAHKRGLDLCFTIKQALKVVNGVTGGLLSQAQKYIGKVFKGVGIKIPGLTKAVLNLGSVLKVLNIPIPNVTSLLNVAEAHIMEAIHLNPLQQYIDAVPQCKPVLTIG